jgi:hypothetical protein
MGILLNDAEILPEKKVEDIAGSLYLKPLLYF